MKMSVCVSGVLYDWVYSCLCVNLCMLDILVCVCKDAHDKGRIRHRSYTFISTRNKKYLPKLRTIGLKIEERFCHLTNYNLN